jgi:hypothetical protein
MREGRGGEVGVVHSIAKLSSRQRRDERAKMDCSHLNDVLLCRLHRELVPNVRRCCDRARWG